MYEFDLDFLGRPTDSDPFGPHWLTSRGPSERLIAELVRVRRTMLALALRRAAVARLMEDASGGRLLPRARAAGEDMRWLLAEAPRRWNGTRRLAREEADVELPRHFEGLGRHDLADLVTWALELDPCDEGRILVALAGAVRGDGARIEHALAGTAAATRVDPSVQTLRAHAAALSGDTAESLARYEAARERAPAAYAPLLGSLVQSLEVGAESHARVHAASVDELLHPEDPDLERFARALVSWRSRGELTGGAERRSLAHRLGSAANRAPFGAAARRLLEAYATPGPLGECGAAGALGVPAGRVAC